MTKREELMENYRQACNKFGDARTEYVKTFDARTEYVKTFNEKDEAYRAARDFGITMWELNND